MKQFAKLSFNGKVLNVVEVHDNEAPDEVTGIDFLTRTFGHSLWMQSYFDGTRKNPANLGMTYDEERDAFIPIKTYPSWIFNETTCNYDPPVAYPDDGKQYGWNEEITNWEEIII